MAKLIEARSLDAGYGSAAVVRDLDLHVDAGEVVALLGPNGAGKTTTLLTLSGELAVLGGEVRFKDEPTKAPLYRRARAGLALVTEERMVFKQLTTEENLRIARVRANDATALFPELGSRMSVKAGMLSGGEQQMLSLARALARKPKLLMADELSLGLAPLIVDRLLSVVRSTADDLGLGVLLVEQHVQKILNVADRVYVLRQGRLQLSGTAKELKGRIHEIEASYLSSAPSTQEPAAETTNDGQPIR